jgi:cytochrome c peroxidase
MAKLPLVIISVSLVLTTALAVAAEDDTTPLMQAQEIFRPLPNAVETPDFPSAGPRVELGRMLFFDPRLTIDANMSCSSCHQPAVYGTDALPRAIGVKQRPHPRNASTVLNTGALNIIHWRGDRDSLEDQVAKAAISPDHLRSARRASCDHSSVTRRGLCPAVQGGFPNEPQPITLENITKAISAYERTLLTPAPFDAYLAGNQEALSPAARAGLAKFINTGCVACHNDVGIDGGMMQKFGVVEDYWKATGSEPVDKGRAEVTNDPADLYVFRVASLRNVAMTPPYFHDGSVATLPEAVKVMARVQLGVTLSDADTRDIVAFLEGLTGEPPANFTKVPTLPPGFVIQAK